MISLLASIFWLIGEKVAHRNLSMLIEAGVVEYGPLPIRTSQNYDFNGFPKAFHSEVSLRFLSTLSKNELKSFLINSTHKLFRDKMELYLDEILNLSQEYKVDPIWIISVVTVESGFNPNAKSRKNAQGLMQVRPDTAKHLRDLLGIKSKGKERQEDNLYSPNENLELGVFYLKRLLQNFRYRYDLATIAYNQGPNSLRANLKAETIIIADNNYLKKVNTVYDRYLQPFRKLVDQRAIELKKSQKYTVLTKQTSEFELAKSSNPDFSNVYHSERL